MITEAKKEIINNYDDLTLLELIKQLDEVQDEDDLIKWLEFATEHNYYTGSVWSVIYNENKELENKVKEFINDEDYLKYLTYKCDASDIFLFQNSKDLLKIESGKSEKITHALNYSKILTLEEFNNIYYYYDDAAYDFINEGYMIPEHLTSYINYESIISELSFDENIYSLRDNTEFILDDNNPNIRDF